MAKYMSDRLRQALDDPNTRYRLVDAWILYQKRETLLAAKAQREAAMRAQSERSKQKADRE